MISEVFALVISLSVFIKATGGALCRKCNQNDVEKIIEN